VRKYATLDKLLTTSGDNSLPLTERQDAYAQFSKKIHKFVMSRVKLEIDDHHEAENLVQDILCRVWDKSYQYSPQKKLIPYLKKIIKNMIINYWNRHGKKWDIVSLETFENWEEEVNQDKKFHRDDVFQ
jgi:RNA polymerase sigma factor (sigma-70 family)